MREGQTWHVSKHHRNRIPSISFSKELKPPAGKRHAMFIPRHILSSVYPAWTPLGQKQYADKRLTFFQILSEKTTLLADIIVIFTSISFM